ncbi:GroES-like protein [Bimuria novae-zelandiae CBS 107.79]|uniref:GroES-like protein n=1 Tax=Bimuria novae-zelandiae CBS 107.79 TaxID=1447943 RepID=A0A6A5ULS4_9PLEO|nr:GroES-like protein [Bimuria novae-zelandiae CBS 107.79]
MSGNRAAYLLEPKGRFEVRDAPIEQPGPGEVLVKVHFGALQPADQKVAKYSVLPVEYPSVLGGPVSGIVEALGERVDKIAIGDRIVSGTKLFGSWKAKYGGMQRYAIVDQSSVIEIGDTDFTKALTLASWTPPGALFGPNALNMHYPSIPAKPLPAEEQGKKILIWGGSSAMGSLSISYAKQAGYTVISTSSPHNFDLLKSLGADHIFDHSDSNIVEKIRALFPIHYWFDTISLKPSVTTILKILAPEGEKVTKAYIHLLLPLAAAGNPTLPEGVTAAMHKFQPEAPGNEEWAKYFLSRGGFMEQGIKSGVIKGVSPHLLGGLDKVSDAIEELTKGVSAKKLVIDPWA